MDSRPAFRTAGVRRKCHKASTHPQITGREKRSAVITYTTAFPFSILPYGTVPHFISLTVKYHDRADALITPWYYLEGGKETENERDVNKRQDVYGQNYGSKGSDVWRGPMRLGEGQYLENRLWLVNILCVCLYQPAVAGADIYKMPGKKWKQGSERKITERHRSKSRDYWQKHQSRVDFSTLRAWGGDNWKPCSRAGSMWNDREAGSVISCLYWLVILQMSSESVRWDCASQAGVVDAAWTRYWSHSHPYKENGWLPSVRVCACEDTYRDSHGQWADLHHLATQFNWLLMGSWWLCNFKPNCTSDYGGITGCKVSVVCIFIGQCTYFKCQEI